MDIFYCRLYFKYKLRSHMTCSGYFVGDRMCCTCKKVKKNLYTKYVLSKDMTKNMYFNVIIFILLTLTCIGVDKIILMALALIEIQIWNRREFERIISFERGYITCYKTLHCQSRWWLMQVCKFHKFFYKAHGRRFV